MPSLPRRRTWVADRPLPLRGAQRHAPFRFVGGAALQHEVSQYLYIVGDGTTALGLLLAAMRQNFSRKWQSFFLEMPQAPSVSAPRSQHGGQHEAVTVHGVGDALRGQRGRDRWSRGGRRPSGSRHEPLKRAIRG